MRIRDMYEFRNYFCIQLYLLYSKIVVSPTIRKVLLILLLILLKLLLLLLVRSNFK